jgi:hypothetical protein
VPEGLCAVAPEGLCSVLPEGLCSVVPEGLCSVMPEGLYSVVPEGLCAGWLEFGVCVGMCECMLVSGDLWCFSPPPLAGGSALSCDRAGQPRVRAGRLGGRPACGWGVMGNGCLCVGVNSVASCGVGWCKLVCGKGGAYRMRTTGAASSSSIVSDM